MPEKVISIEMNNGNIYNNPVILSPENWQDTDRTFIAIRTKDKREYYLNRHFITKITTTQGEYTPQPMVEEKTPTGGNR